MAALFSVKDIQTNKMIVKEKTATEIAKQFGCNQSNVRNYAGRGYKIKGRYLVIDAKKDSKSDSNLIKDWENMRRAAQMIKNGTGKIRRVYIKGKYVLMTVPV